jgi:hypothetical protein
MAITPFQTIYNRFASKITDDMYMEWTAEETRADMINILLSAIPRFAFPKFKLYDYDSEKDVTDANGNIVSKGLFNFILTVEEVEIFAELMFIEWVKRQIGTVDVTRLKYSSSDFKFTSQANHLEKLLKMKAEFEATNKRAQSLYNRRKVDANGYIKPNFAGLGGSGNGN